MAVLDPAVRFADVPAAQAHARPEAIAIVHEGAQTNYGQLATQCEAAAALLSHAWGVRAGDRIAWLGANHPAQLLLLFALARLGGILLPLNFRLAPAEWDTLMADCAPVHLVHDDSCAAPARELGGRNGIAVHHAKELVQAESGGPVSDKGQGNSPVLLVYTSGTTGRARAAVHTQDNLLANMRIAAGVQGITTEDRIATMLPLFHVGGLCIQTLPALFAGARVILLPRFTPDAAFECFEQQCPSLTLQVPATMKALVEHPRWPSAPLASLRAVWAGSSLLPTALIGAFHARGLPVCNVYGSTETGPFSIALPPQHAMDKVGSCGWPAPGVEARLVDVRDGAGELLVRGPNVVRRYWPGESTCDAQGWFHTGDLATQSDDGSFAIVGRARDLIISGGENIHPAEIEGAVAAHEGVLECAAFGVPDDEWGEAVALAVVRRPGATLSEADLREWLGGRIARYKMPRLWLWVDALPKTALGKVQRQALTQLARR